MSKYAGSFVLSLMQALSNSSFEDSKYKYKLGSPFSKGEVVQHYNNSSGVLLGVTIYEIAALRLVTFFFLSHALFPVHL